MKAKILIVLFWMALVMPMAGCIQPEMTINGTVTNHSSGELLKGIEVSIYTYQQSSLEYLPPLGDKITNTSSDEQGKYELRVPADYKNKKVVVFCHDAPEGWEVISMGEVKEKIDLVFGAPVPIGVPTEKLSIIIPIVPGENMFWSWSQRGLDGNYTGSGTYRVMLEYESGEVETEFKICKATKLRDIDITTKI